eukprot:scaffold111634_cov45-Phaeocystis_antarctica.AAC.1
MGSGALDSESTLPVTLRDSLESRCFRASLAHPANVLLLAVACANGSCHRAAAGFRQAPEHRERDAAPPDAPEEPPERQLPPSRLHRVSNRLVLAVPDALVGRVAACEVGEDLGGQLEPRRAHGLHCRNEVAEEGLPPITHRQHHVVSGAVGGAQPQGRRQPARRPQEEQHLAR